MSRCPISYENIAEGLYYQSGLKKLDNRLTQLKELDFTKEELLEEAAARSGKISLEGVQPKLSAILSVKDSEFILADTGEKYVITYHFGLNSFPF